MVVRDFSNMEEVRVCQVVPVVQRPSDELQKKSSMDETDDGEESDPEVMQVIGSSEVVNLRHKKQRINGTIGNSEASEDHNRERPMSWEGELSEDDGEDTMAPEQPFESYDGSVRLFTHHRPSNSPMCIAEKEEEVNNSPIRLALKAENSAEASKVEVFQNDDKCPSSRVPAVSGSNHVIAYMAPVSPAPSLSAPSPFGNAGASGFSDRIPPHNSPYGDGPATGAHSSSVCVRPIMTYNTAATYSESPSPVLNRPTSSSSSRSSYSPTQSPLLSRQPSLYSHAQSPVMSRHSITAGTSSDGSVYSPTNSPLQGRHISVIESSVYSPSQSPNQSRHRITDGLSPTATHLRNLSVSRNAQYGSGSGTRSLTVTPDHGSNHDGMPNVSYPYVMVPDHQTVDVRSGQGTPVTLQPNPDTRSTASSASIASSASDESNASDFSSPTRRLSADNSTNNEDRLLSVLPDLAQSSLGLSGAASGGISRQQLLSGPCPICGDRISGFHYGIFSCESCKGFFKRTVQNKKNYVCLRGGTCHIAISTRKKCPACRFEKCLRMGMKLEAIREDRTRGGRSTYQCSYSLPTQLLNDSRAPSDSTSSESAAEPLPLLHRDPKSSLSSSPMEGNHSSSVPSPHQAPVVPSLVQEIISVEHLWHYTDKEINRLSEQFGNKVSAGSVVPEPLPNSADGSPNLLSSLCNIADHRLYKIVKWCKSLPLFREIQVDDQIALLINSWCELLLLSCCYRSIATPNEIRVSMGKSVTLDQAQSIGMAPVIERMLNLTDLLRRLQVDQYEFVCLKVIILLTSDASGLKEPEKVRGCKKQVLEALQAYTCSHYPSQPSKFGELLLCIPELERACQISKESLAASKQRGDTLPSFNLLMELLRGDH